MPNRAELTDDEWQVFYGLLLLNPRVYADSVEKCRGFLNAVLWILRSGGQWRLLPATLGKWNSVFKRFSRWCKQGIWQSLHNSCIRHPDLQHILIDSTVTRAHACAAGALESTAQAEALGRSKGGYTTKIHAITDALGNPLDFILTGGQASDIGQAAALLQLTPTGAGALLGDKGYDSDAFVEVIQKQEMQPVIPPRSNRVASRHCDWFVYKEVISLNAFSGKLNIIGECFHDLKSSPETTWALFASFQP